MFDSLMNFGKEFLNILWEALLYLLNYLIEFVLNLVTEVINTSNPSVSADNESVTFLVSAYRTCNSWFPCTETLLIIASLLAYFISIYTIRLILKAIPTVW